MHTEMTENDIPKICANCVYSKEMSGVEYFFCEKNGVMNPDDTCKKYKFDIFKYNPRGNF